MAGEQQVWQVKQREAGKKILIHWQRMCGGCVQLGERLTVQDHTIQWWRKAAWWQAVGERLSYLQLLFLASWRQRQCNCASEEEREDAAVWGHHAPTQAALARRRFKPEHQVIHWFSDTTIQLFSLSWFQLASISPLSQIWIWSPLSQIHFDLVLINSFLWSSPSHLPWVDTIWFWKKKKLIIQVQNYFFL